MKIQWINRSSLIASFFLLIAFIGRANGDASTSTTIINPANGKCIADPSGSTWLYTQFVQWSCDGGSDDNFQLIPNLYGSYTIVNLASNYCMSDLGNSTSQGAAVGQYTCNSAVSQNFKAIAAGSNYQLQNERSGYCLSIPNKSNSNGTGLVQEPCGGPDENFKISGLLGSPLLSPGSSRMINVSNGLCIADAGYSTHTFTSLVQWSCDGLDDQFEFTQNSNGAFTIMNQNSNLCMDDLGHSAVPGASIGQYTCDGELNQQFVATPIGAGVYSLKNAYNGLCLSIPEGSSGNGVGLVEEPCGGSGQGFAIDTSTNTSTGFEGSSNIPKPPSSALHIKAIQELPNWSNNTGAASQCANGVPSATCHPVNANYNPTVQHPGDPVPLPGSNGVSAEFELYNSAPYSTVVWSKKFATSTTVRNYILDFYVYVSTTNYYVSELDLYNSLNNGQRFMMANQCDRGDSAWNTWNEKTQGWIHNLNIPCDTIMSAGVWHHMTFYNTVNTSNNSYTYHTVRIDGTDYVLDQTQYTEYVGWPEGAIGVQVQLDTNASGNGVNEYIENMQLYAW